MYKLCNMDPQECLCHATGEISWICQKRSISGKKKAGIFKLALNRAKNGEKKQSREKSRHSNPGKKADTLDTKNAGENKSGKSHPGKKADTLILPQQQKEIQAFV